MSDFPPPSSSEPGFLWSDRSFSFANALLDPDIDIPEGVGAANNGGPSPKRFSVYRNNVVVSLMEALAAAYPSTKALLGDSNFDRISRAFVALHPPQSAMMQTYGESFPEFVKNLPALSDLPFLHDLARVEWCWNEAYHALDEEALTGEQLEGLTPEQSMALVLDPMRATSLVQSPWCVDTLFKCRFEALADGVDFDEPQSVLIAREQNDVHVVHLTMSDAECLQKLMDGKTLGEAVGSAIAVDPQYNPAQLIALCLQINVFKSLHTHN